MGVGEAEVYEPAEDSFLLAQQLPKRVKGAVLDMGTGSGIQAEAAARSGKVSSVLAVDVNTQALRALKNLDRKALEHRYRKKISVLKSDLFSKIGHRRFDTIIFNPPYLPEMKGEERDLLTKAIVGGKKGWELIARFMDHVSAYLKPAGKIILLCSSLTGKEKVLESIAANLFDAQLLSSKQQFFETLSVYEVSKSPLLRELEEKGFSQIHLLSRGKRGVVYRARYRNKDYAIKVQREKGTKRIDNEVHWLSILNKKKIGPRLLMRGHHYCVMEFIAGESLWQFIAAHDKTDIKKMLRSVFEQCYVMDELRMNKFEMHHPYKHIILTKEGRAVQIDFERCRENPDPKNVTQFTQFVTSTSFQFSIMGKNIWMSKERLRRLAQFYKENRDKKNLEKILREIR